MEIIFQIAQSSAAWVGFQYASGKMNIDILSYG